MFNLENRKTKEQKLDIKSGNISERNEEDWIELMVKENGVIFLSEWTLSSPMNMDVNASPMKDDTHLYI